MVLFVIISDVIYVIGGYSKGTEETALQSYDVITKTWTTLQPMREKRMNHAVCIQGERIIVAGGTDGADHFNTCEIFNTELKWLV